MKLVNIVCSGDLGTHIILEEISKAENKFFIYKPSNYHGGYVNVSMVRQQSIEIEKQQKFIIKE